MEISSFKMHSTKINYDNHDNGVTTITLLLYTYKLKYTNLKHCSWQEDIGRFHVVIEFLIAVQKQRT